MEQEQTQTLRVDSAKAIDKVVAQIRLPSFSHQIASLIILNFALIFIRPEDETSYSSVGWVFHQLHLSLLLSLIPLPFWLARVEKNWTIQTKALAGLILFGIVFIPFAVNNFWAASLARDLFLLSTCIVFPMAVFLPYRNRIRQLITACLLVGLFLGVFSVTHQGRGPGAFLGDENDLCFALAIFFPLPLFLFPLAQSFKGKFSLLIVIGTIIAGVVMTFSRGGFVGIVIALIYVFWKSKAKWLMSFVGIFLIGTTWYFAPEQYWEKMETINDPSSGTAKARQEIWKVALRIFLDPHHMLTGVGMGNVPYSLGKYEPRENLTRYGTSIAGRAVHSLYLQILAELGLIGIGLFLMIVIPSLCQNEKRSKEIDLLLYRLSTLAEIQRKKKDFDNSASLEGIQPKSLRKEIRFVSEELKFIQALSLGFNASWLALLSSGAFISVLYYPPLWVLTALTVTVEIYWRRIRRVLVDHP